MKYLLLAAVAMGIYLYATKTDKRAFLIKYYTDHNNVGLANAVTRMTDEEVEWIYDLLRKSDPSVPLSPTVIDTLQNLATKYNFSLS